jgi:hypothetical protein
MAAGVGRVLSIASIMNSKADFHTRYISGSGVGARNYAVYRRLKRKASFNCSPTCYGNK